MRNIFIFLALLCGVNAWASGISNVNKNGVILDGHDPVSYFKSSVPEKGRAEYQVKQEDAIYWFSSEENKNIFLKDPKKYMPAYGGWCAYAVADSKSKVEIDPKSFLIQDGKLLVFYNGLWGNTKKKWQSTKDKDAKTFLKEAEANWPEVKNKAP